MRGIVSALGVAVLVSACAAPPTADEFAKADHGREMKPDECETIARGFIADRLKDPAAAQFRGISRCEKGFWGSSPILGQVSRFGYTVTGEVNGKNAYGGYVGYRHFQVLMLNGSVVRYCLSDGDGLCVPVDR